MEIFNKLPGELQLEVMSYTNYMYEPTWSQLWVFKRLPPHFREMVLSGNFPRKIRDVALKRRCNFPGRRCPLRFSLYGYFSRPGSIEEHAHWRKHGMCSECKREEVRQAARRQERLDGLARFQQAFLADDEIGMLENERWCSVDSLYDQCHSWEDYLDQRYHGYESDY